VGTSVVVVRRRIGYRTWHALHVCAYVAIALAFSHQLATGQEFQRQPVARAYWWALYGVTVGVLVAFRVVLPVARSLRHRLRVERVVQEAPGVVSIEISGRDLERLRALPGQSLRWRFLARGHWMEAHPFSLSAAPDGRRLRITVKELGDYTARMTTIQPGTRVIVEGPYGGLTSAARRRSRAALIAGGVGITPLRALLEDMPGEVVVIYRAGREDDLLFRGELDELSRRPGVHVHYVLGDQGDGVLSPDHLRELVPDIVERDVYVCGPVSMTEATRASLRDAGVLSRQIVSEAFG
jgi:predicted ferric reductase